jgi:hypothetical protein
MPSAGNLLHQNGYHFFDIPKLEQNQFDLLRMAIQGTEDTLP